MELLKEKYIIRGALNKEHGVFLAEDAFDDAAEGEKHLFVLKILTVYNADVFKEVREACPEGVPSIYDMWEENGLLYVVEEHIQGRNLRDIIDERKPFRKEYVLSELETINTAIWVLQALERLHRLNPPVIHRDVKPSNIIIGEDGKVWLIDLNALKEEVETVSRKLHELTEEDLEQVTGGCAPSKATGVVTPDFRIEGLQ